MSVAPGFEEERTEVDGGGILEERGESVSRDIHERMF